MTIKISDQFSEVNSLLVKDEFEATHITLRSWLEDFLLFFRLRFLKWLYTSENGILKNYAHLKNNLHLSIFVSNTTKGMIRV